MPFHFSLEAVLHLRRSIEHQQELRLQAANQQVARVRHALEAAANRINETQARAAEELRTGTTAAAIQFALQCEATLQRHRQELRRELARAEGLRNQQQRIFEQARRERETFESLRQQQLREYQRDAARRQQRQVDDLFLLRQTYLRQFGLRPSGARHG